MAQAVGVGLLFAPSAQEMYPGGNRKRESSRDLSPIASRAPPPGPFTGVATVVTKLLSLSGRCRAFFGEKDFQQLALVRRLVADLDLDVEIVGAQRCVSLMVLRARAATADWGRTIGARRPCCSRRSKRGVTRCQQGRGRVRKWKRRWSAWLRLSGAPSWTMQLSWIQSPSGHLHRCLESFGFSSRLESGQSD